MRIAVEARYLLAQQKTGVENYTCSLLAAMLNQQGDHELHLYIHRRPTTEEAKNLTPFLTSPKAHFHIVPPLKLWLKLWMPLAAQFHGTDIGLFPGSILPWHTPFKAVMMVYDLCWATFPEFYPEREIRIFRDIYPRCLAKASLVFAISEYTKQDIIRVYGTPAEKIRVIPCAVDPIFHPIADAPAQARTHWNLDPGYILAVGTAHPRKNITTLLKAYALLKQAIPCPPLVLIGPAGDTSSPLAKLTEELSIADHVRWLGYVPPHLLPALYSSAGVFVMPSFYEGFGIPVAEAMACGTPVVCSNTTALPEVTSGAALLADPHSPEAFADALTRILSNPNQAQDLRLKGLTRANQFSWEKSAKLALECLKELMAKG